ncbi:MAG TPA: glycosyltransferase, partial [Flavobacteriales bacterium]|nr:glycosyltransferase [Flavobacteriales bacterium]
MPLVVNGRFLTRPTTGVERYGRALLQVIATAWPDARVVVPRTDRNIDACGLEVVPHGIGNGHWWEQSALPAALRKGDVLLSPANTGPLRVRQQVLVLHDLAFLHQPEWFDRRFVAWYGFLLPRLARRCAQVITVSTTVREELMTTFAIPGERIHVVPPFQALATAVPEGAALPARPYLLLVGAHDPRKGADRVLAWYRQLHAPAYDLILVGRKHRAFAAPPLYPIHNVHVLTAVDD